jgi:AcrR family transcriptional regulator
VRTYFTHALASFKLHDVKAKRVPGKPPAKRPARSPVKATAREVPPAPPSAGTSDARSETQRRILDAALGVFAERGFEGATTAQIASRAGVAEKTLFANFGSKERLYQATLEPATVVLLLMPEALRTLAPVFARPPQDLRGLLRALLENRVAFALAHQREARLLAQHLLLRPDGLEALARLFQERIAPVVVPLFERLAAAGSLRKDVPKGAMFRFILTSAVGYVLTRVVLRPDLDWDDSREIETLVALLADGLEPRRDRGRKTTGQRPLKSRTH